MNDRFSQFTERFNRWYWGLLLGMLFPLFGYILWWLFFVQSEVRPDESHIRYGFFKELNLNVLRLCVASNLLIFYFFLNRKLWGWARGIIASVLAYIVFFIYILYLS